MPDKVFFASDFHLGVDGQLPSSEREKQIIRWMDSVVDDALELYLVGDVFDYWFEYGAVIPKGYTRLLGKLAEWRDRGIPIHFFTGNHDMWMFSYLEKELGIPIYRNPIQIEILGKQFYIGHGDGLGPADHGYKFIKKVFSNRICQWLFERIHPNLGLRIMKFWSQRSRDTTELKEFHGKEKEWLIIHCEEVLKKQDFDYFVFGHRHLPIDYQLSNGTSRYINLGDWLNFNSYAVFDGSELSLQYYETDPVVFGKEIFPSEIG